MKTLITKSGERSFYLIEEFKTKVGLDAKIVRLEWNREKYPSLLDGIHDHYNGYVALDKDDTTNYYNGDVDIDVHGGVTYQSREKDGRVWVGFDLGHYDDHDQYDIQYVKDECERLAEQIKKHFSNIKDRNTRLFGLLMEGKITNEEFEILTGAEPTEDNPSRKAWELRQTKEIPGFEGTLEELKNL